MIAPSCLARPAGIAVILALCLILTGCGNPKVNKANFDEIKNGMTLEEVQDILGKGGQPQGDGSGVAAQVGVDVSGGQRQSSAVDYVWESGNKKITVGIQNGK